MDTNRNNRIGRGLAIVLLLAAGVSQAALARVTPLTGGGSGEGPGLGGVWGHIDIPEIGGIGGIGTPGFLPGTYDPNAWLIGIDDLDLDGPKTAPIQSFIPQNDLFGLNTGSNDFGSPTLFPPSDPSVGFVPGLPDFGGQIPGRVGGSATLIPVFNIPAPGVPMLLLTAAGIAAVRRRRV